MIHTARTVRTLQAVAIIVGLAIFLWSTGLPTMFSRASAASITSASDTLESSAPGAASNHTIAFTIPMGMLANQTILLTFPGAFSLANIDEDDVDILVNGNSSSTAGTNGAGTWGVATTTTTIEFTAPNDMGVSSSSAITIRIGSSSVDFGIGNAKIINPSSTTTTYEILIGGSMQDSGSVRVAIVDQVTVSANVNTSLTFTVSGVNSSSTVNSSPTTTAATSTPNTLPFGTLEVGVSKTLAHDLYVSTNASNGYTVTVQQTGDLQSTTGATIDGFIDGNDTQTPASWQGPSASVSNPDTYGHWGITSTDGTTTRSLEFDDDLWVSGSTTPIVIMGHDDPANGIDAGIGYARIGYQAQISALQEAGDDYTTTLRYVVTPTF
jgi:hypothetical protein